MLQNHHELLELVSKYNVPGPRYTSYPTALQFNEDFDRLMLEENLSQLTAHESEISVYIHIPFCQSLCWYCGCTKVITRNPESADRYLDYLEKESELITRRLHPNTKVRQIHFGGGTPTFLSPDQILRIGHIVHKHFDLHPDVEFSVEIDPRRVDDDHIAALIDIGCNRASLGVQDTNEAVQKAIHRIQPFEQTQKIVQILRDYGIKSINLDLIYGLPEQTLSTFHKTIEDAVSLNPDRFAIYSYAHLPSIMPSQKLLNESDLPPTEEKLRMLVSSIEMLPDYGYRFIGMDHFAKEDDELSQALNNDTLQRNFQGYSTHANLNMIGLGMSSISQNNQFYTQNDKDLNRYYELLDNDKLPIIKLLKLSAEDILRKEIIMEIMCKAEVRIDRISEKYQIPFEKKFASELNNLTRFSRDGFLRFTDSGFQITPLGRLFVRNIAMEFDQYLNKKTHKRSYSRTI